MRYGHGNPLRRAAAKTRAQRHHGDKYSQMSLGRGLANYRACLMKLTIASTVSSSMPVASGSLRFVQPDVGKWGGVTGCLRVARAAAQAGLHYCPHWLGGAIGLMASLHLKAGEGGPGWVEIDSNPNPLRESFGDAMPAVHDGHVLLADAPGIGLEPSPAMLADNLSWHGERTAA